MNKLFIVSLLCIVLVGCNIKKQDRTVKTIEKRECESMVNLNNRDSIIIPQTFLLFDWKIVDDKVVFCLQDRQESFLEAYAYPSFQLLYGFGQKGQGPGEYIVYNWCDVPKSKDISLYDIMKSTLYLYEANDSGFVEKKRYDLLKDETGFCRPFTKCCQVNDSVFLLKEDNDDSTSLHLINLSTHNIYSTYTCTLRDEKETSYTPFDYCFSIINNHILIAYNYIDRLEFLKINENKQLECQLIIGSNGDQSDLKDYNKLMCCYLCIRPYNHLFYCLKSNTGSEFGNQIDVYDVEGNYKQRIVLNQEVNSIHLDNDGNIVAYKENQDNTAIYLFGKFEK